MSKVGITRIIINQLGGSGRLSAMVGARDFLSIDDGLRFKFTAKAKNKANHVQITLNGNDLYDVKFMNYRSFEFKDVSEHNDVFCGDLVKLIENETGLYLSL